MPPFAQFNFDQQSRAPQIKAKVIYLNTKNQRCEYSFIGKRINCGVDIYSKKYIYPKLRSYFDLWKMSQIPLRYRNWWEDWDAEFQSMFPQPFHTSRLFDQRFGLGLNRDELLAPIWAPTPSWFRSGYIRPWSFPDIKPAADYASSVKVDADKFEVNVVEHTDI